MLEALCRALAPIARATPTAMACLALAACSSDPSPSGDGTSGGTTSGGTTSGGTTSGGTTSGGTTSGGASGSSGGSTSKNSVDLTVSGDVTATLKGMAGTCGGVSGGASFRVKSEELGITPSFEIAVVILSEPDWATPPTVLNVTTPTKASYAWGKKTGTVVAQRDRSRVDIDAQLVNLGGSGTVTIKGSIVCAP